MVGASLDEGSFGDVISNRNETLILEVELVDLTDD